MSATKPASVSIPGRLVPELLEDNWPCNASIPAAKALGYGAQHLPGEQHRKNGKKTAPRLVFSPPGKFPGKFASSPLPQRDGLPSRWILLLFRYR